MNEWPRTQVHADYDVSAAKERLRVDTRRPYPNYPLVYDPTRPRTLDRRQAETMPWLLEAVLILLMVIALIALFVAASLTPRS